MRDRQAIACRGVSHRYRSPGGSIEAVHAVDFALGAGAVGALAGPSGSGKSTLLRLLAGLDVPSAGTITVNGAELTAMRPRELRRYRRHAVTYLAQRPAANLVPHLAIRDQLDAAEGPALAEKLGIAARVGAHPTELSGGEQARAGLAAAVSRGAALLLIDEPTAELDRRAAARVIEVLADLSAGGRTIVLATHDADLLALATTILELGTRRRPRSVVGRRPRGTDPPIVALERVAKGYRGVTAVSDVSFRLGAGELALLIGRSGSGKSTVLMIAAGWIPADRGTVRVPGGDDRGYPRWTTTAYLAQRFGLLPELSVFENVELPLRLTGISDRDRVRSLLERLDLLRVADHHPRETSIGQQQRAALARALVVSPAVLFADEPTSHQDADSAERVWAALAEACDAGTACLVATHDESAAPRADRFWRLVDGRTED